MHVLTDAHEEKRDRLQPLGHQTRINMTKARACSPQRGWRAPNRFPSQLQDTILPTRVRGSLMRTHRRRAASGQALLVRPFFLVLDWMLARVQSAPPDSRFHALKLGVVSRLSLPAIDRPTEEPYAGRDNPRSAPGSALTHYLLTTRTGRTKAARQAAGKAPLYPFNGSTLATPLPSPLHPRSIHVTLGEVHISNSLPSRVSRQMVSSPRFVRRAYSELRRGVATRKH